MNLVTVRKQTRNKLQKRLAVRLNSKFETLVKIKESGGIDLPLLVKSNQMMRMQIFHTRGKKKRA
jgi:hypothetical protein